ncbi:MAG: hypothetical protein IJ460_01670 [Clostridia bacterium]|nr:hypothetical protein [Clostridia bacterium]
MRKTIYIFLIFTILLQLLPMPALGAVDMEPKPLVFTRDPGGKYIYCNNHEFIRRQDLADTSNPNAKYIMNNTLEPDKYAMFISHVNHTELRNDDGTIAEPGFDIELDVVFKAIEDTVIEFTAMGFEVPAHSKYYYEGGEYKFEEAWGCMNAWADYLGMPIKELDSGMTYNNHPFDNITVTIPAGEQMWLSEYIRNYSAVPFYRPALILADFEVKSGRTEANVAAVKSTGKIGDRRYVHPSPAFGFYDREKQYKGIADSLNKVDVSLEYTIADWTSGELPVIVYNDYVPEGNRITHWYTNLNPYADPWNKANAAGSDMLTFKYVDDSKLRYYGSDVPEDKRDNVWVFAPNRSDYAAYPGRSSGTTRNNFVPNDYISTDCAQDATGNFGNYGVRTSYKITVTNEGKITRYINYNLATTSNNIVILRDEYGNPVNDYAICKGETATRTTDTMACVEIPGETSKTFTVEVILPTNYVGGMENSFAIANVKSVTKVYENVLERVPADLSFTGREYIKWDDWDMYTSPDGASWTRVGLTPEVKKIFHGNWNQYEILYAGDCYMVKPCLYDSAPYYGIRELFKTVYFLNTDFTLRSSHTFYQYPTDMSYARGVYYITAGSKYMSTDLKEWTMTDGSYLLPVDNGGTFAVRKSGKDIYYCADKEYLPSVFEGGKPEFVESAGDIYYYTKGSNIYVSADGMYFDRFPLQGSLEKISYINNKLTINGNSFDYTADKGVYVMADGKYIVFGSKPYMENDRIYVPYGYIREICGEKVPMPDEALTVRNGATYVAIGDFCRKNGYEISYDEQTNCAIVNTD